jgi:hypothetical protein
VPETFAERLALKERIHGAEQAQNMSSHINDRQTRQVVDVLVNIEINFKLRP